MSLACCHMVTHHQSAHLDCDQG